MDISSAFTLVRFEVLDAIQNWKPHTSAHDGWAKIYEEVIELFEKIREDQTDYVAMREEAVQVAAMAIRFLIDLVPQEEQKKG